MDQLDLKRLEGHFPTIYVTLISVLLALCLEDMVSEIRAVENKDLFHWAIACNVAATSVAAWTGYSFIAITQVRRPRLMDSANVFSVAIGLFIINSTIDAPRYWFFVAMGIYMWALVYAVVYNFRLFGNVLPYELKFEDWKWCIYVFLPFGLVGPLAGWYSYRGELADTTEVALAFLFMTQPISWMLVFSRFWKRALNRVEAI